MSYACYSIFTQVWDLLYVKALCLIHSHITRLLCKHSVRIPHLFMTAHISWLMYDRHSKLCRCRGNPSCWMWFVFILFHLKPELYALVSRGLPCAWVKYLKPASYVFPLSEEIFRKSAVPPACQKPPVYHGICSAVSYSSLAMADILSCIFGYQVNINCKGTNKPVHTPVWSSSI